uniref:Uncharacterized protein n=1 Tax=Cacopsylla melanoneura TaxID=428564 RepID=A0A8D8X3W1_9HEMI
MLASKERKELLIKMCTEFLLLLPSTIIMSSILMSIYFFLIIIDSTHAKIFYTGCLTKNNKKCTPRRSSRNIGSYLHLRPIRGFTICTLFLYINHFFFLHIPK